MQAGAKGAVYQLDIGNVAVWPDISHLKIEYVENWMQAVMIGKMKRSAEPNEP